VNEQNEIMSRGENWEKSVKNRTKIYFLRALLPNLLEVKQQSIIQKIRLAHFSKIIVEIEMAFLLSPFVKSLKKII
jgi:hypothetical protein